MIYKLLQDKIIVLNKEEFNIAHILECGQIFNFEKIDNNYIVYSQDKMAKIIENQTNYEILTSDPNYFVNFFDLNTNYTQIKNSLLGKFDFLDRAIKFGYGIRILNQDLLEVIISFIISANNNIPRIKKSIKLLCEKYGENKGNYFAFPTLLSLSKITESEFKQIGLGYRAGQMVKAIQYLQKVDYLKLLNMQTNEAIEELLKISGVGPKVADCIMLFGVHNKEVFPVDTWINKIYNKYFTQNPTENRVLIRKNLTQQFGLLSGYAQQYLFYFGRSGEE